MVKVNNDRPKVQESCDSEISQDRYRLIELSDNRKPIHIFVSKQGFSLWEVLKDQE